MTGSSLPGSSSSSPRSTGSTPTPSSSRDVMSSAPGTALRRTDMAGRGAINELAGVLTLFGTRVGYKFDAVPGEMLFARAQAQEALKFQLEGLIGALVHETIQYGNDSTRPELKLIANALTRLGLNGTQFRAGFTTADKDLQTKILTFIKCLNISGNGTIRFDDSQIEQLAQDHPGLVRASAEPSPSLPGIDLHQTTVRTDRLGVQSEQGVEALSETVRQYLQQTALSKTSGSSTARELLKNWPQPTGAASGGVPVAMLLKDVGTPPLTGTVPWVSAALIIRTLFTQIYPSLPATDSPTGTRPNSGVVQNGQSRGSADRLDGHQGVHRLHAREPGGVPPFSKHDTAQYDGSRGSAQSLSPRGSLSPLSGASLSSRDLSALGPDHSNDVDSEYEADAETESPHSKGGPTGKRPQQPPIKFNHRLTPEATSSNDDFQTSRVETYPSLNHFDGEDDSEHLLRPPIGRTAPRGPPPLMNLHRSDSESDVTNASSISPHNAASTAPSRSRFATLLFKVKQVAQRLGHATKRFFSSNRGDQAGLVRGDSPQGSETTDSSMEAAVLSPRRSPNASSSRSSLVVSEDDRSNSDTDDDTSILGHGLSGAEHEPLSSPRRSRKGPKENQSRAASQGNVSPLRMTGQSQTHVVPGLRSQQSNSHANANIGHKADRFSSEEEEEFFDALPAAPPLPDGPSPTSSLAPFDGVNAIVGFDTLFSGDDPHDAQGPSKQPRTESPNANARNAFSSADIRSAADNSLVSHSPAVSVDPSEQRRQGLPVVVTSSTSASVLPPHSSLDLPQPAQGHSNPIDLPATAANAAAPPPTGPVRTVLSPRSRRELSLDERLAKIPQLAFAPLEAKRPLSAISNDPNAAPVTQPAGQSASIPGPSSSMNAHPTTTTRPYPLGMGVKPPPQHAPAYYQPAPVPEPSQGKHPSAANLDNGQDAVFQPSSGANSHSPRVVGIEPWASSKEQPNVVNQQPDVMPANIPVLAHFQDDTAEVPARQEIVENPNQQSDAVTEIRPQQGPRSGLHSKQSNSLGWSKTVRRR